jgi:hypothetical protein
MSKSFSNAKDELGIDMTRFYAWTDEEILLYQEIKERPEVEIGEEINIDFVKKSKWVGKHQIWIRQRFNHRS